MDTPLLRIIVAHSIVAEVELHGPQTLGRADDNTIVLEDDAVSAHHGRVAEVNGEWTYSDVGSRNGSRVAAGPTLHTGDSVPLDDQTQIKLGHTVIEFRPVAAGGGATGGDRSAGTGQRSSTAADATPSEPARPTAPPAQATLGPGAAPVGTTVSTRPGDRPHRTAGQTPAPGTAQGSAPTPSPTPSLDPASAALDDLHTSAPGPSRHAASLNELDAVDPDTGDLPSPTAEPPSFEPADGDDATPTTVEASALRPRVIVVHDQGTATFDLPLPRAVIGRAADCDVVIDGHSVSAHHAEIRWEQGGFVLADLQSTNGTRLALARLRSPTPLATGSHIIVGDVDLLFLHDPSSTIGTPRQSLDPEGFVRWLRGRRKLSKAAARAALERAKKDRLDLEEVLVADGHLSPGAITELRHNAARTQGGAMSSATVPSKVLAMRWIALGVTLVGLVAAAYALKLI